MVHQLLLQLKQITHINKIKQLDVNKQNLPLIWIKHNLPDRPRSIPSMSTAISFSYWRSRVHWQQCSSVSTNIGIVVGSYSFLEIS